MRGYDDGHQRFAAASQKCNKSLGPKKKNHWVIEMSDNHVFTIARFMGVNHHFRFVQRDLAALGRTIGDIKHALFLLVLPVGWQQWMKLVC
jgi:hypothetical protein